MTHVAQMECLGAAAGSGSGGQVPLAGTACGSGGDDLGGGGNDIVHVLLRSGRPRLLAASIYYYYYYFGVRCARPG